MKISRRQLLSGVAASVVIPFEAKAWRNGFYIFHGNVVWKPLGNAGGGLVVGLAIAADGTKASHNDSSGGHLWGTGDSQWRLVYNAQSIPFGPGGSSPWAAPFNGWHQIGDANVTNGAGGPCELQVADTNSQVCYMFVHYAANYFIYQSTNQGVNWTQTNWPSAGSPGSSYNILACNSAYNRRARKFAIDPANANVVYATNPGDYPVFTLDGGATWTSLQAAGLPSTATNLGASCWTFDKSGGTTTVSGQTVTAYIYVNLESIGVFFSSNGGVSFTQISGLSDSVGLVAWAASIASDGTAFYLCGTASGNAYVWRWVPSSPGSTSGTWTAILTDVGAGQVYYVAAHPSASYPGVVVAIQSLSGTGKFTFSSDYGATTHSYQATVTSPQAPWQANQINAGFSGSSSSLMWDPSTTNMLWQCMGQGIWSAPITLTGNSAAPAWSLQAAGIGELITRDLVCESGTNILYMVEDALGFQYATNALDTPPSHSFWNNANVTGIVYGFSAAISPANTSFMCSLGYSPYNGYSTDGGSNWTEFGSLPSPSTGSLQVICCNGTSGNEVCILSPQGAAQEYPYLSTNKGNTWTKLDQSVSGLSLIPSTGASGWDGGLHICCADYNDSQTFYMINTLTNTSYGGTYKTTDAGTSWTFQGATSRPWSSGLVTPNLLKSVPGYPGWLICSASTGGLGSVPDAAHTFQYSKDGGQTWNSFTGISTPDLFALGVAASNSAYPTIYVVGFYNNVFGVWFSIDFGTTWKQITSSAYGQWPMSPNPTAAMDADKSVFGRIYLGLASTSAIYSTAA